MQRPPEAADFRDHRRHQDGEGIGGKGVSEAGEGVPLPQNQKGESQSTAPQEGEQKNPAPAGEQQFFQHGLKAMDKAPLLSDDRMEV